MHFVTKDVSNSSSDKGWLQSQLMPKVLIKHKSMVEDWEGKDDPELHADAQVDYGTDEENLEMDEHQMEDYMQNIEREAEEEIELDEDMDEMDENEMDENEMDDEDDEEEDEDEEEDDEDIHDMIDLDDDENEDDNMDIDDEESGSDNEDPVEDSNDMEEDEQYDSQSQGDVEISEESRTRSLNLEKLKTDQDLGQIVNLQFLAQVDPELVKINQQMTNFLVRNLQQEPLADAFFKPIIQIYGEIELNTTAILSKPAENQWLQFEHPQLPAQSPGLTWQVPISF